MGSGRRSKTNGFVIFADRIDEILFFKKFISGIFDDVDCF